MLLLILLLILVLVVGGGGYCGGYGYSPLGIVLTILLLYIIFGFLFGWY